MLDFSYDTRKPPLVFIIGTGRSGTTLVQEILGRQAGIGFPAGEQNWVWHPKLYPYDKRRVDSPMYQVDPHRFVEISRATRTWYEQARIDLMVRAMQCYYWGKPLLLKSPMLTFNAEEIFYRYKNVKFISIHRAKSKVIESWVRKDFSSKYDGIFDEGTYREIVSNYIDTTEAYLNRPLFRGLEKDDRFLRMEFEDFLRDPDGSLQQLSSFFGIEKPFCMPDDIFIDYSR